MKLPRKMKKQIKKDIKNTVGVSSEVFSNESFYLSVYNKPLNRVINSLVYLDYPTRDELIKWWDSNYPRDPATRIAKEQKNLFTNLEVTEKNITMGYMMKGKTLELTTLLLDKK